jgi:hypothetical protein
MVDQAEEASSSLRDLATFSLCFLLPVVILSSNPCAV